MAIEVMPQAEPRTVLAPHLVLLMVGHGGGGHKASALAVQAQLVADMGKDAVQFEVIDVSDFAQEVLGGPNGDTMYNWLMKRNMFCLAGKLGHFASCGQLCVGSKLEEAFYKLWLDKRPACVMSFVPFVNVPMRQALLRASPGAKLVTCVTDFESTHAHVWLDPKNDKARNHIIVAGTSFLVSDALSLGYKQSLLKTSGMVVHQAFNEVVQKRAPHQVRGQKAVVYFGGQPPGRAEYVARALLESLPPDFEVVVFCGKNVELYFRLHDLRKRAGALEGERTEATRGCCSRPVPACMSRCIPMGFLTPLELAAHLVDARLVVGKPGPGAVAETVTSGTTFVTERKNVMPQEESVLRWLETTRNGLVVQDLERLPNDLLARVNKCFPKERYQNHAANEVSQLVQLLLASAPDEDIAKHCVASQG